MSNIPSDAGELFFLLESCNTDVEEVKAIILENLNQNKEPASFLSSLVDFYIKPEHTRHRDILAGIREPHDKHLFDKLNDCLKGSSTRLQTLTLFSHIVRKQPSWLYKVANHQLLSNLIKILKTDTEITHLMSAVLIIVTLLPVIPFAMGHYLQDIFEIFTRLASWHTKRSASISEVYLMHLHVAVYALFHRLYSMYPCNFLSYLRNYCNISAGEHLQVFSETIRPMIDLVRMHPMLVLFTKESEVSMNRWKSKEVHDIVAECAKFSLDPIEGTREDDPLLSSSNALQSTLRKLRYPVESDTEQSSGEPPNLFSTFSPTPIKESVIVQASMESAPDWSPSLTCNLSTPPPSQQISPTSSYTTAFSPSAIQKNVDESVAAAPSTGIYTPSQSVTPSPLKVDQPPFKFPIATADAATKPLRSDSFSKSGNASASAPSKTEHISLIKGASASSTVFASLTEVAQKLVDQGQHQFPATEKQDITDMEVATIIGSSTVISSQSEHMNLTDQLESEDRLSPSTTSHTSQQQTVVRRGGKVSSPWCPSPYFESLQSSHRSRSYSQGKKVPRRATVEVALRRGSLKCRSSSLPDLRAASKAQTAAFLDETGDKAVKALQRPQKETEVAPYEHLFSVVLPHYAQQPCPKCHSTAKPSYVRMSPAEILDQYIQTSLEVHSAKASVGKDVDKGHSKGNSINADILRGQIQLLHTQLLYERHKREVHAERNRRLLGKAKRAHALKEQNIAMKDQVKLLENEIASLTEENRKLRNDKRHVLQQKEEAVKHLRDELNDHFRSVTQEKKVLEESTLVLKTDLNKVVGEREILQQDLEKVKAELFNTHHELEDIQQQVALNRRLKAEADKASKELLLTVELNQKYQEKLNMLQNANHYEAELTNLRETCSQEMNNLRAAVDSRDAQVESLNCRLGELESLLLKKDYVIADQKRLLKTVKEAYEQQITACEEKYNSGKQICQQFESEILKLRHKYERVLAERGLRRKGSQGKVKSSAEKGDVATKSERSSTWSSVEATDEASQPLTRIEVPVDSFQRRRASEPIDIDPCPATGGGRSQRSGQGQRSKISKVKAEIDESDESSDGEVKLLEEELTGEEKISGALEPITSQSLASIVDINEAYD